jgi:outer membrane receptor protein involved in Fe transport
MQFSKLVLPSVMLASVIPAAAQEASAPITTVEVSSTRDDQRRQSSAAATVIGHDELVRFGDTSLSDALKRLPGITIGGAQGRPGEVRMRGLGNGYTQILLNGLPMPAGFALDSISPELIERVEIRRAATAATGTQAIAGTIDIILKKNVDRAQRELKLGSRRNLGRFSSNAVAQFSGKGVGMSYTVPITIDDNRADFNYIDDELKMRDGVIVVQRRTYKQEQSHSRGLTLSPRLNFKLGNADTVNWQNFATYRLFNMPTPAYEENTIGPPTQYPVSQRRFDVKTHILRSDVQWNHPLGEGAKLEFGAGLNDMARSSFFSFAARDSGSGEQAAHLVDSTTGERGFTLNGKLLRSMSEKHALVFGWDGARQQRRETRAEVFLPDSPSTPPTDERYHAQFERLALYIQDDWTVNPALSVNAGLRWESLQTRSEGNAMASFRHRASVLSPVLQTLYKLTDQRQLRLAVTRTFKAPTLVSVIPRRNTVDNDNSRTNPDFQGNPGLRPERAWGLDFAYEHYFGKNALVSASAYVRRIDDVTVDTLFEENNVWTMKPANQGRALSRGIELETKFPLRQLFSTAPALDVRANFARNWSRIDSTPGPDNRIDQQTPVSASIGLDYRLAKFPLSLGASFSYQGGGPARRSLVRETYSGPKRELELLAIWTVSPASLWRLSASNVLHQDYVSATRIDRDGDMDQRTTTMPTTIGVRLLFEHKL